MKRLETALKHKPKEGKPLKYCKLCKAELRSISQHMLEKKQKLNMAEPKAEHDARRHTKMEIKALINKQLMNSSHRCVITERRQQDVKEIKSIL